MKKKILMVLNYYYPYISGLSEVARLLAERYVQEGHEVTVLCSNHDHLAAEEMLHGVRVVRAPIWFKISKKVRLALHLLFGRSKWRSKQMLSICTYLCWSLGLLVHL